MNKIVEDKSIDVEVLVSREEWKILCKKHGQWCDFEDVKKYTSAQADVYIQKMSCWSTD